MSIKTPNREWPTMHPKFVTNGDGTVRGPFWYSNAWKDPDNHERMIFGDRMVDVQQVLKKSAFNTAYEPSDIAIHLARAYINHLEEQEQRWKTEAIEAKKELSKLKRLQNQT